MQPRLIIIAAFFAYNTQGLVAVGNLQHVTAGLASLYSCGQTHFGFIPMTEGGLGQAKGSPGDATSKKSTGFFTVGHSILTNTCGFFETASVQMHFCVKGFKVVNQYDFPT